MNTVKSSPAGKEEKPLGSFAITEKIMDLLKVQTKKTPSSVISSLFPFNTPSPSENSKPGTTDAKEAHQPQQLRGSTKSQQGP